MKTSAIEHLLSTIRTSETVHLCIDAFRSLYFWLELLFAIVCAILIFLAYILTP